MAFAAANHVTDVNTLMGELQTNRRGVSWCTSTRTLHEGCEGTSSHPHALLSELQRWSCDIKQVQISFGRREKVAHGSKSSIDEIMYLICTAAILRCVKRKMRLSSKGKLWTAACCTAAETGVNNTVTDRDPSRVGFKGYVTWDRNAVLLESPPCMTSTARMHQRVSLEYPCPVQCQAQQPPCNALGCR